MAALTASPIRSDISVFIKVVPLLAAIRAPQNHGGRFAAQDVLANRHWFEVIRIHTSAVAAEMIKLHPLRNRPDRSLVCETVSSDRCLPTVSGQIELSVPRRLDAPEPGPTSIIGKSDPLDKTFLRIAGRWPRHYFLPRRMSKCWPGFRCVRTYANALPGGPANLNFFFPDSEVVTTHQGTFTLGCGDGCDDNAGG